MVVNIENKLKQCLYEMGISSSEITDNANLSKDLGLDSLDITDLIIRLEGEFGISIPDADWNGLQTVGQIKHYVMGHSLVFAD